MAEKTSTKLSALILMLCVSGCDSSITERDTVITDLQSGHLTSVEPIPTRLADSAANVTGMPIIDLDLTPVTSNTGSSPTNTQILPNGWLSRDFDPFGEPVAPYWERPSPQSIIQQESEGTIGVSLYDGAVASVSEVDSHSDVTTSASSIISLNLSDDSTLSGSDDEEIQHCVQVGEVIDFGVTGVLYDIDTGFTISNLTAYSTLDNQDHPSVNVISHSDERISLTVSRQDIVDLTIQYQDETTQISISAINNGGSRPLLLKKRFHYDICGFALYTESSCNFTTSESEDNILQVNETSVTTNGCTVLHNPDNVPIVEINQLPSQ